MRDAGVIPMLDAVDISSLYAALYVREQLDKGIVLLVFEDGDKRVVIVPEKGDGGAFVKGAYRFLGVAASIGSFTFSGDAVGYENKILSSMTVGRGE